MSPQLTPIKPSSLKARFARNFLQALKNLKKNSHRSISNTTSTPSTREIHRRSHRVKLAAYESMASAVGSRRAWSRAITLKKSRNRARNKHGFIRRKRVTISSNHALKRRRKIGRARRERNKNPNPKKDNLEDKFGAELRKLVPGGKGMDMCKLLDETTDYVKCLATQVEVMRKIVNFCSI